MRPDNCPQRARMIYFSIAAIGVWIGAATSLHGQTPDCQSAYREEVKVVSDEHLNEAKGCQGNGICIAQANTKKATGLKKAATKRAACNKDKIVLKADTATLEPTLQWTKGPGDTSIWTDIHGKQWVFPNSQMRLGYKLMLDRSSIRLYEPGGVPLSADAEYKEPKNQTPLVRSNGRRFP